MVPIPQSPRKTAKILEKIHRTGKTVTRQLQEPLALVHPKSQQQLRDLTVELSGAAEISGRVKNGEKTKSWVKFVGDSSLVWAYSPWEDLDY